MSKKLNALRAKIKELEQRAKKIESESHKGIAAAVELIRNFDLSLADWKQAWRASHKREGAAKQRKGRKVPFKYADAAGNNWSGRGRPPLWLVAAQKAGKKRDDFLIRKPRSAD